MTRDEALAVLFGVLPDNTAIVACNGHISRSVFACGDRPRIFYMIGSMGLACSVGLGIALASPSKQVAVLDGDGNLLMNLGALATIAAAAPRRFLHVCLDNGCHGSTGGQPTVADRVDLGAVARAAGYRRIDAVDSAAALEQAVRELLAASNGPAFVHARIRYTPLPPDRPRVSIAPADIAARVRAALRDGKD